jgi:hypothetical protein
MTGFLGKAKDITGLGLGHNELYARAFTKGVLLKKFLEAADMFDKAARKFAESGNPQMENQAAANALLYRYLATGDPNCLLPLLQRLQSLPQIEEIELQTNFMPTAPLIAELACREVEARILGAQNDILTSRDLHKVASEKFQAILRNPLITYIPGRQPAADGHNQSAEVRFFYHSGMYKFNEAMTKKDLNPALAVGDLSEAKKYFTRCNDQHWLPIIAMRLEHWSKQTTCWICHREVQGYELHYSLYQASVAPYWGEVLKTREKEDQTSWNQVSQQIAVCTPCGSMVTLRAQMEADKVRQELNARVDNVVRQMEARMNELENKIRWHHH